MCCKGMLVEEVVTSAAASGDSKSALNNGGYCAMLLSVSLHEEMTQSRSSVLNILMALAQF